MPTAVIAARLPVRADRERELRPIGDLSNDPAVKADCDGCASPKPPVVTADSQRIPSGSIIARGRGLPIDNGLREL